jgi:hypothetical protein
MAAPLDPAEEILASLPPEKAALLRARLRPLTLEERMGKRNEAIREAVQWYPHLASIPHAVAGAMGTDLARLQPIISRIGPHADGDGKRGALARILRLNGLNRLKADRLEEIIAGRRC